MFNRMIRFNIVALPLSAVLSLTTIALGQTTYYVNGSCGDDSWTGLSPVCEAPNGPKKTIQAGIDAADHFDSVEVADGTYRGAGNKNIEFSTKEMSIRSAGGPGECIIDCESDGLGFTFCTLPDDRPVTIEGFTVRNGYSDFVAGICVAAADVTIVNCVIENCIADGVYNNCTGGIYILNSRARILRTVVRGNRVIGNPPDAAQGGGIGIYGDLPVVIEDCSIVDNELAPTGPRDRARGAGVFVDYRGPSLHMARCVVSGNRLQGYSDAQGRSGGGGIYISGQGLEESIIEHSEISHNLAIGHEGDERSSGGGAWLGEDTVMRECSVIGNRAVLGGGLYLALRNNADVLHHITLRDNHAELDGGGAYGAGSYMRWIQFVENTAGRDGGGLYYTNAQYPWQFTEFIDNEAGRDGGGAYSVMSASMSYVVMRGNHAGRNGGGHFIQNGGYVSTALMDSNSADERGGALFVNRLLSPAQIGSATITRNSAGIEGGGIFVSEEPSNADDTVTASILWDNTPDSIVDASNQLVIERSNIQGGWPGMGNRSADPRFSNPREGDFRLTSGSPCIDATDLSLGGYSLDLAGNPRALDDTGVPDAGMHRAPLQDMGCYEFQGTSTGFVAVHPRPGVAGQNNQLQAAGATPGNIVYFVYGFSTGSTGVPGCPGLTIDIANPRLAAQTTADGSGYASKIIRIPGAASGRSIILQAVDRAACEVSNAVGYRFP